VRWPDLIKSNGGGANAILVRNAAILEHRVRRLCWVPERRWVHAVRLKGPLWVGNLHATVHDAPVAIRDSAFAAATVLEWAAGESAILGGDFNVRRLALDGFDYAGGHDVDHVFVTPDLDAGGGDGGYVLERGRLSDHAPVAVDVSSALPARSAARSREA
jgi:endonuclease/exonuclease/phosphatase family metal-dependent hydrolase